MDAPSALWSGLGGLFTALGPVVGGVLVESISWGWRAIFFINPPLLALAWWLTRTGVAELPGRRAPGAARAPARPGGAILAVGGLALVVFRSSRCTGCPVPRSSEWSLPAWCCSCVFVVVEAREPRPMLPPGLFRIRTFAVANLVTLVVYGASARRSSCWSSTSR